MERSYDVSECTLNYAFNVISGKWKPYIIWYLGKADANTMRYSALKRSIPWQISNKMFTQQLRELENDGIIKRKEHFDGTLHVNYSLTEMGKFLVPALYYIRDWAAIFGKDFSADSIDRTLGERNGNIIDYSYTPNDKTERSVKIQFNFGETE